MPSSYVELLASVRRQIRRVSLEELRDRLAQGTPIVLVDVRERDELKQGTLPGAIHVPRGALELEIEAKVPDKAAPIVVYCAGGARSALAARTLTELGYTDVASADPGFSRWSELGFPVARPAQLGDAQRERYARHLRLPEVGEAGQLALLRAKVLLLGAGGLGSPVALYLAAAGVGTIGLVDSDSVEGSNLQRQILHTTGRVGMPKVDSAERAIRELNPEVKVVKFHERLTRENVDRVLAGFDLIVDGCDNFPTRYLINDAAVRTKQPVVHGSVSRFEGQVTVFDPASGGPCYRCLYPAPPPRALAPSCQDAGVLGILPGVIGLLQATEALKLLLRAQLLDRSDSLSGRLLTYDALRMRFLELKLRRDEACPACGATPSAGLERDYDALCEG